MALSKIPVLNSIVPSNPIMTIDRDAEGKPIRYSVDAATEHKIQNQRIAGMIVGPIISYVGYKCDLGLGLQAIVMLAGIGITTSSFYAYKVVREAQKVN